MTRDLIARLVAIADERPLALIGYVLKYELPELRAQAEAMNNGAAQGKATSESSRGLELHEAGRASGESSTALGRAEDPPSQASPAAAPPSATQPVAWCVAYDDPILEMRIHSNPTMYKQEAEAIVRKGVVHLSIVDLYATPPDLAARVKELEALLREAVSCLQLSPDLTMEPRIRAALAKGDV